MSSSMTPADDARETAPTAIPGTEPAPQAVAASPAPQMPASVRIAVVTMSLLAGLLLLYALLAWVSRVPLAQAYVRAAHVSFAAAEQRLILWLVLPSLLLGVLLALSTWFLPKRRAWARWTGLTSSAVLCLLSLYSVIAARAIGSLEQLLVLVISLGAMISLLSGSTARWVPRLRARR